MSVEAPEPIDPSEITDRFKLVVVIIIVTTTLIAGGVGYLESRADSRSDNASAQAEQYAIEALTATTRSQGSGLAEYDAFIASQTSKTAEAVAWRRFLQNNEFGPEQAASIEQEVWASVADESRSQSAIDLDGPQGPDNDPVFPFRYLAERERSALVATALQDGANEESSAWGEMAVTFTAILTLLAVSLYLLGSSLAMRREIGRILAVGGTVLAGVASIWAITVASAEPRPQNPQAAELFADGMVALNSASGQESYKEAERLLTRAIDARPTFARAYVERSGATFQAGSTQVPGVPSSISSIDAIERSAADLRTAESLGLESSELFNNLGFDEILLAVKADRPELLDEGIAYIERAIERDPDNPLPYFNRAMGLLASGKIDEAKAGYEQAMLSALYLDAAAARAQGRAPTELRNNAALVQQWVTGALTDLQIVIDNSEPPIADEATALKQYLVGSATRDNGVLGAAGTDATISDIRLLIFPAEVQHEIVYTDPGEPDKLWVQWYHRPTPETPWSALYQVSGPFEAGTENVGLQPFLPLSFPAACLPVGEYRAEFYSDGTLLATEDATAPHEQFQAVVARAVNVGFCRMPDWVASEENINGLVEGFVAPDQTAGLFIVRLPIAPGEDTLEQISTELDGVDTLRSLFLPDTVGPVDTGTFLEQYFLGFEAAETRDYTYEGGNLRVGAGAGPVDPGSVVFGMVFGPDEMFAEDNALGGVLFTSMLRLE